jgi:hypothetical protein
VLLGQGYRTPNGVIMDEYGATLEYITEILLYILHGYDIYIEGKTYFEFEDRMLK